MRAGGYIFVISNGTEEIRIDFESVAANAELKVVMGVCQREKGTLYMVVPRDSIDRGIWKVIRAQDALVETRLRRPFWLFGGRVTIPTSDLVWKPDRPDFPMEYGWNAFYMFERPVAMGQIMEHYTRLKKQKGLLDNIACFRFDPSTVLDLEGLLYLAVTSHDLEALTVVPVTRSLEETAQIALSVMEAEVHASAIEQQRSTLSNGKGFPKI